MVDVDHFKFFNDRHGHAAGDIVLRMIAATLRHSFRQSDTIGRYGGEEFVIVMPETDRRTASEKLETFRRLIETTRIDLAKTNDTGNVTISAGLAGFPEDGTAEDDLLSVADERLFQAKKDGRNRIIL